MGPHGAGAAGACCFIAEHTAAEELRPPAASQLRSGPCPTHSPANHHPRRLASPAKPDGGGGGGGGSQRLEAELGEIKGLLAEILRSPSGSRTPGARGAAWRAASSDASP